MKSLHEAKPSISAETTAESLLYWSQGCMVFVLSSEITGQMPGRSFLPGASAMSLFVFWVSCEIRELVGSLCWISRCFSLLYTHPPTPPKHYIMLPGVNLSALAWSHLCWSFRKGVFFSKRAFVCALSPPHFNNCHFLSALPHVLAAAQMNLGRRKTRFQTNSSIFYFTFH